MKTVLDNLSVKRQKGRISKRLLQENKACQIFRKTRISYPLIRLRAWDLLFCLIAAELWYYEVCFWNKSLWLGKLIHLKTFFFCSNSFFCFSLFSQENKFIRVASFDRGVFCYEWFWMVSHLPVFARRYPCHMLFMTWMTHHRKKIETFFFWVFFGEHSRFTGQQGKGEAISLTSLYHVHPLHRHLDISRAITADSSLVHIASSCTRTGNLWFQVQIATH